MNWSRELVARCIPQSKNKRNPTREAAPQTDKRFTFIQKTFH